MLARSAPQCRRNPDHSNPSEPAMGQQYSQLSEQHIRFIA